MVSSHSSATSGPSASPQSLSPTSPSGSPFGSSTAGEPSITFHPEKRRSSFHFPQLNVVESIAGGAHFTAIADDVQQTHHRRRSSTSRRSLSLSPASSHGPTGLGDTIEEPAVVLDANRQKVLDDVLELFCSRPTLETFERSWRDDAVFEDPLSKCTGYNEYAPQWFAMAKVFPHSRTLSCKVISSTHGPVHLNQIVYDQEQEYTMRGLGIKRLIRSTVVIDLDEDDKIMKLEDKWEGSDQPHKWGLTYLRKLNAKALPWLVRVPRKH